MRKTVTVMAMTAVMGMAAGCKTVQTATETVAAGTDVTEQQVGKEEATMPQGRLMEIEYEYQDMNMERVSHPRLKRTDGGATLTVWVAGKGDVDLEVSDTLLDAARTIIEEERMYAYDGYYSLPPEIARHMLDGYRWEFRAVFEQQQRISSGGRHNEPKGDGLRRINTLLINAATERLKDKE